MVCGIRYGGRKKDIIGAWCIRKDMEEERFVFWGKDIIE